MFKTVAKAVFVLWLGALLALGQVGLAASVSAGCAAKSHSECECGSCAPGCKCCLKSGSQESTPAPVPANAAAPQDELVGAIFHLVFKLAPQAAAAGIALPPDSSLVPVPTVPIFERDCSYLI
jgi:hypothetical protein